MGYDNDDHRIGLNNFIDRRDWTTNRPQGTPTNHESRLKHPWCTRSRSDLAKAGMKKHLAQRAKVIKPSLAKMSWEK